MPFDEASTIRCCAIVVQPSAGIHGIDDKIAAINRRRIEL